MAYSYWSTYPSFSHDCSIVLCCASMSDPSRDERKRRERDEREYSRGYDDRRERGRSHYDERERGHQSQYPSQYPPMQQPPQYEEQRYPPQRTNPSSHELPRGPPADARYGGARETEYREPERRHRSRSPPRRDGHYEDSRCVLSCLFWLA